MDSHHSEAKLSTNFVNLRLSEAKSSSKFVDSHHSQAPSSSNFVTVFHSQAKSDNSWICAVEFVFHSSASLSHEVVAVVGVVVVVVVVVVIVIRDGPFSFTALLLGTFLFIVLHVSFPWPFF